MLEKLQRRNYAKNTIHYYLKAVWRFANHFHRNHTSSEHQAHLCQQAI
jgi:hypothetical protein